MKKTNPFKLASLALFAVLNLANANVFASGSVSVLSTQDEVAPANYLNLTSMCSNNPAETRRWRVRNHTTSAISYTWDVYGTNQSGSGVALPGDNFFETVTVPGSPNTTRIFWVVGSTTYSKVKASGGAQCQDTPASCYAEVVVDFNQKKQNDGSTISIGRSNPLKALGAPENNDTENFVSLGFGGDITLKFGSPIKNGEGADVRVIESTFGSMSGNCQRYPETIRAFASQDGCNFVWIGDGCQDVDFDLGPLAWAQYIKLVDISDVGAPYQGTPVADAYDVDGIMCLNGYEENPIPAVVSEGASEVVSYLPGTRKNGTPITSSRTNPENALGLPQGTDVVNFVSLGFGGSLILKFPYVIFDNPNTTDLDIVETSFGNPSCASYPEEALVEGSLDGENWIVLGEICLDEEVDITSAGVIQYIRITDRSAASSFGGSADGFDVDGVVVINKDCGEEDVERRIGDNITTANEVTGIEVYPNPFDAVTNVVISTGDQDNFAVITVSNYLGQAISAERVNVGASSVITHTLNLDAVKSGIYFIAVETNSTREVVKVVKN